MNWTHKLGLAALTGMLLGSVPASAQVAGWLEDRDRAQGPGFQLGDFELHPGLGVEIGYDSNLYYSQDGAGRIPFRDSAILRAVAHLMISSRGPARREGGEGAGEEGHDAALPAVRFRGGLSGSFYHFFNDENRTNMEVDADLELTILPGRPFSIVLANTFGRRIRPFTELVVEGTSFARLQNDGGIRFDFQTDGGVLRVSAGYNIALNFFEDAPFGYGNSLRHAITLSETFRFLPQTAIIHDTSVRIIDFFGPPGLRTPEVNDGILVRTRVGLNGAITPEFSVLGMVGYGAGFFEPHSPTVEQEFESLVAQVEARWQILPNVRLSFGYDRDFYPSLIGNFYRMDRGYIRTQFLIDRVFLLGADVSLGYFEFGRLYDNMGGLLGTGADRDDIRFLGSLFAEYRFTDWLGVNATFNYRGTFTDYQYDIAVPGMGPILDPAGFNKFQVWLGVRVFY
ncbi:MAG: hypothetical protein KF729_21370 [Sandaracinaceae bacterium]|nr:hypothetical protein [Sandaracinaceae bacterium]